MWQYARPGDAAGDQHRSSSISTLWLRQDVLDDGTVDIGQTALDSIVVERQPFVIEPQ